MYTAPATTQATELPQRTQPIRTRSGRISKPTKKYKEEQEQRIIAENLRRGRSNRRPTTPTTTDDDEDEDYEMVTTTSGLDSIAEESTADMDIETTT